jgi:type IV pilus assembly protein PilV
MELTNMKTPKQTGFTMLEVLVTMIIVSFGLLGIAGIIMNGLKNNQSSYARSQASWLANDIVDRMRANRAAAEGANSSPYNLAIGADPTGATVAAIDLTSWRSALETSLPSGTGAVSLDNTSKKVTVTVQWDESRIKDASNAQQFIVETKL